MGGEIIRERQEIQNQTDQRRSKIRENASMVLEKTGEAVKSTAGVIANVAQIGLNKLILDDLKMAGNLALAAGSVVGPHALNPVKTLGSGALNMAKIGAGNLVHNVTVTGQDIKFFMEAEKPNFMMFKNAIIEGMRAYQQSGNSLEGPRSAYLRTLPSTDYMYSLGSSSSSS